MFVFKCQTEAEGGGNCGRLARNGNSQLARRLACNGNSQLANSLVHCTSVTVICIH
jgi:hypothetical protein